MIGIGAILSFVTGLGGTVSEITKSISNVQIARAKAETDQERIKHDAEIRELTARRDVLVAEAGHRLVAAINACVRAALAVGPISYVLKYYLWDKVIGAFVGCANLQGKAKPGCETFATDGLSPQMAAVLTAVIAFYLGYNVLARWRK